MAIVKMKRLQVLALERDHDRMLRQLQHMGCLEISEPDAQALPDTLHRCDTAAADCLARQRQLQTAMDTLRRTAPPPRTGPLTPRPRITEADYLDEAALAAGTLELPPHGRVNAVDDLIPVDQVFGFQGPAVFYLVSEFVTKEDGKIGISIGRTSPLVFWLDGRELARAEFETYLTPENIVRFSKWRGRAT